MGVTLKEKETFPEAEKCVAVVQAILNHGLDSVFIQQQPE
jgi:hypothetical protein